MPVAASELPSIFLGEMPKAERKLPPVYLCETGPRWSELPHQAARESRALAGIVGVCLIGVRDLRLRSTLQARLRAW